MFANPYVNVYNLQIGEELCIPVRMRPRTEDEMVNEMETEVEMENEIETEE